MIRSLLRRLKRKTVREDIPEDRRYYKLSYSCQIPKLDLLYERYFGRRHQGLFVEVGAFDGEYTSNTSALAHLGWKGFYIEPVPDYFHRCKDRHKDNPLITVDNMAIGDKRKTARIQVSGPLSSLDENTTKRFTELEWARGCVTEQTLEVNQTSLDEYLRSKNISQGFDLLVIDVEGYEWEVLKGFPIHEWRPHMVIIELHDQNPDYPHLKENCAHIVEYFEKNEYRIIYKDFTNTVYITKDA